MAEILHEVQGEIDGIRLEGVEIYQTGTTILVQRVYDLIVYSLLASFLVAFGLIFLTLLVLLRTVRLALLAMVPNVLPVVFVFAALHLLGETLRPTTTLMASIILGLAVDDTIHIVARLRLEWVAGRSYEEVVSETLRKTSLGVISTSVILALGFLALLGSYFWSIHYLGLLTALSLAVALAYDLLLFPALLLTLRPPFGPGAAPGAGGAPQGAAPPDPIAAPEA
jgi:hypothetical protein